MLQPVAAYPPYPHQRLHQHAQQHHHLLHRPLAHDVYAPQPPYHAPLLLAPAYRPLHIPLHQPPPPQQQQQQQTPHALPAVPPEQHSQQLALAHHQPTPAFSTPGSCPEPGLQLHHQHHNPQNHSQLPAAYPPRRTRPPPPQQQQQSTMAYQASEEEMAEMQRLSAGFEAEVTGPLVGERQPSSAITQEYAAADTTYQTKTAALPQKYSHYRKLRGDGMCGWRAVAFGYLERLLYTGDSGKCLEEEARLRSLANVVNSAGFDPLLFEDFADTTLELLRKVANGIDAGNGDEILLEAFNDEMTQNYIITHFKSLTAAWMKTHPENYAGYMIGQTVDQYCEAQIMPVKAEIEHLGLSALKDVLLSPASLALEVMYLDRSIGDEVNLHRFDPISGYTAATVRLLYRPGHYDLLYKYEDVPPPPPSTEFVAAYLSHNAPHPQYESIGDYSDAADNLMFIPGMSIAPSSNGWLSGPGYGSDFFTTPFAPLQTCAPAVPTPVAPAPQPQMLSQTTPQPAYGAGAQASHVMPPTQIPTELAIRSMPHAEHAGVPPLNPKADGPFRPSHYEYEADYLQTMSHHMPLTTSIFKNSHFNTAHFQNPEFQPEEWRPDDEYVTNNNTKAASRSHRSSG